MITLNEIAEIAEISKCSALKMAERHAWPMRKAIRGGKRINLYNITRDEIKTPYHRDKRNASQPRK